MKLPFNLDSMAQSVSKLTLKGGLAGKICHVLIYVALAMAVIAWSVQMVAIAIIALTMIFCLTFVMLWRLINLADKNPQSALMEGAEFLLHEQMMVGTKNHPQILVTDGEIVESAPLQLSPEEKRALDKPEELPPIQLPAGQPAKKEDA